jgi:hypothetical protein
MGGEMSDTKFTPGEWRKDGNGNRVTTQRGIIAECPVPQKGGVFDCQANAHLIAAAPELYAALEEMDSAAVYLCAVQANPKLLGTATAKFTDAREHTRAALAKARGESP